MQNKTRLEIVVESIIAKGTINVKDAAWRYLRSESGRAEAEMISVSHNAQLEITSILGKINPKNIAGYRTDDISKKVEQVLSLMLSRCERLAVIMVTSNILSGKISLVIRKNLSTDLLLSSVSLTDSDRDRISRLVNQIVGRLQMGASLTLSSVKKTLQVTAIRANMPIVTSQSAETKDKDKDKDKDKSKEIAQELSSITEVTNQIDFIKFKRTGGLLPTLKEIEEIKKDPLLFVKNEATKNATLINNLHTEYFKPKDSPISSKPDREKALKEVNGSAADRAVFEMNELIRKQGLSAFVDKGGRRWSLESYCAMTTRSASAQSENLGEVFADEEHDLYYLVPHGGSCSICAKYEGRVYSRSGTNPNYPALASVFTKIDPNGSNDLDNTYLTIHPNCRHKLIKYVEKSHTKAQQKKIQEKSNEPFVIDEKKKREIELYKRREKVLNDRNAAMKEFQTYLQVLPPKDVCGNFIKFYEHKQKNDAEYKEVKRKYRESLTKKEKK